MLVELHYVDIKKLMKITKFSIQEHWSRKRRTIHFDLRILNPEKTKLWSWAIPKAKFPEGNERILIIRTPDHKKSYMYFDGILNTGDKVKLYDEGECYIIVNRQFLKIMKFKGTKIDGVYNFIRISSSSKDDSWILMRSKKN